MKPVVQAHLRTLIHLLDWTIDTLRETLNADATHGVRKNGFTRKEWKNISLVLHRLEGANDALYSIVADDGSLVATCGTAHNPHPDDGEIYSEDGNLHIHVERECLAIVKNHNPDDSESDEERKHRIDDLRFMVTGVRSPQHTLKKKKKKKKDR